MLGRHHGSKLPGCLDVRSSVGSVALHIELASTAHQLADDPALVRGSTLSTIEDCCRREVDLRHGIESH